MQLNKNVPIPRPIRERALASGVGLLVALVALELVLRVAGGLYGKPTAATTATRERDDDGRVTILCVGDSLTHGTGATAGGEYPAQLEGLLDEGAAADRYRVVNGGIGGGNSTMILEQLPALLDATDPAWMTLLAGTTNQANYYGFNAFADDRSPGARLEDLLFHVRAFRLLRYGIGALRTGSAEGTSLAAAHGVVPDGAEGATRAFLRWHERRGTELSTSFREGAELLRTGRRQQAITRFEEGIEARPQDAACHWGLGTALRLEHRFEEAAAAYRAGLDADPDDPNGHHGLGELLLEAPALGDPAEVFTRGLEIAPEFAPNHWGMGMVDMLARHPGAPPGASATAVEHFQACVETDPDDTRCYPQLVDLMVRSGQREPLEALLRRFADDSDAAAANLLALEQLDDREALTAWIRADLEAMIELAEARGTAVVLQRYPYETVANDALAAIAAQRDLPIVDQQAAFVARTRWGTPLRSLFSADQLHPNNDGYAVMAWELARVLRDEPSSAPPHEGR